MGGEVSMDLVGASITAKALRRAGRSVHMRITQALIRNRATDAIENSIE